MVTDVMWDRIEPLMPADPVRGRRWADHRRTLEAIAWKHRTCSPWRDLPDELGSFQTAHKRLIRWAVDGTWERILAAVLAEAEGAPRRRHAVRQTRGPLRRDCSRRCHQRVAVTPGRHTAGSTFHVSGRSLPQKTHTKSSSRTMLCSWQSGHRRNTTSWVKPEGRPSSTSPRA